MMKGVLDVVLLLLLLFFTSHVRGTRYSPPGKPTVTRCRSPEKETFTCWWDPGSDGGLPTTHALYYRKENSDTLSECPDYHTAGENSCFFNKNDTSIWVNYNITVVATNALGSTFSDSVDIDVMNIVKPNSPEMLKVTIMEDNGWPFLRASWEPPHKADTRSGWITLMYEIRVKLEEENDWEVHLAGQQKIFNIFSLRSGGTYLVQVRCKVTFHGFWSEWSSTSKIKVPDYFHREKSVWVLITVFSSFIFLILAWLLHMSSHSLKHCILPPVPGPKIKGFDKQLLKNGKSEEVFNALVVSDFPPTNLSSYEDLLVEYLEVYVPEEQELMLEESKDLHDGCLKSESTSDSDSGRGSCDSHTLLMDKCGDSKEEEKLTEQDSGQMETEAESHQKGWEEEEVSTFTHDNMVSPDMSSGRVKTWPSVFSPLPQYGSSPQSQRSSLEMSKQHYLSDSLFPPGSMPSYLTQPGHSTKEALGPNHWEFSLSNKQPHQLHPQPQTRQPLQSYSDINISSISRKRAPTAPQSPTPRPNEYVEVQRVNKEDMVLLQPVTSSHPAAAHREEYSKVKGMNSDKLLLLQRQVTEDNRCTCEDAETDGAMENCHVSSVCVQKPTACTHTAMPAQDEKVLAGSGYIDTATMFTLPTH